MVLDPLQQTPPHIAEALAASKQGKQANWVMDQGAGPGPASQAPSAAPKQAEGALKPDLTKREHRFEVHWKDPNGNSWDGAFLSVAPDMRTEIAIARTIADHKGGQSDDKLPGSILDLITGMAYAEHMLPLDARPVWARDIGAIPYPELAKVLIQEVVSHYTTFRSGPDSSTGS